MKNDNKELFKPDKKYNGTILHGLYTNKPPAFKPKQNKPLTTNRGRNSKHALETTIHQDKPTANIPRYKVAEQIWSRCKISNIRYRSNHGL